jgi:hypothetical protein
MHTRVLSLGIATYINAQPTMHRMTAKIPPAPRLAVFAAPPVKVATPGLTRDVLAVTVLLGEVDSTGMTLIVWYTTVKLLLDDLGTVTVEYVIGEREAAEFETSFAGEPGAIDVGMLTGVVSAVTGHIVVYRT